jgi:hypothetical protein
LPPRAVTGTGLQTFLLDCRPSFWSPDLHCLFTARTEELPPSLALTSGGLGCQGLNRSGLQHFSSIDVAQGPKGLSPHSGPPKARQGQDKHTKADVSPSTRESSYPPVTLEESRSSTCVIQEHLEGSREQHSYLPPHSFSTPLTSVLECHVVYIHMSFLVCRTTIDGCSHSPLYKGTMPKQCHQDSSHMHTSPGAH